MRKEIENWWKQAEADLKTADNSFRSGDYYASVFWCQQSVEKALKATYIIIKKTSPSTTHSLIYLASEIKINKKYFSFLRELTPGYVTTRYPDIADTPPYEIYDKEKANNLLLKSKEFLKWLKEEILTRKH